MMPVAAPVTTNQPCSAMLPPERLGLLVGRCVARRAGRAEDRHLPLRAIRREDRERAPQLAERLAQDFQIVLRRSARRAERFRGVPQPPIRSGSSSRVDSAPSSAAASELTPLSITLAFPRKKLARRGESTVG